MIMIVVSNIGAITNEILVRGKTKQLLYNFVFINDKFPDLRRSYEYSITKHKKNPDGNTDVILLLSI